MGKVKLSKEQEIAIIHGEANLSWVNDNFVFSHCNDSFPHKLSSLADLKLDDLIRALYIGYEVEPEFEVGDWVNHRLHGIGKVIEVNKNTLEIYRSPGDEEDPYVWHKKNVRHATKQETWWAKHGRNVWELKPGDILFYYNLTVAEIVEKVIGDRVVFESGTEYILINRSFTDLYKVACFSHDRKDVDND